MIFSSSTCFSVQLLRSEEAELWFHRVCDRLGIPPDSSDVVHHLQDIDIDDLITRSSFALSAFRPIWDNITITFDPREIVRNCSLWDGSLRTLVKGVCKNEVRFDFTGEKVCICNDFPFFCSRLFVTSAILTRSRIFKK
jgi:hypothetical protein